MAKARELVRAFRSAWKKARVNVASMSDAGFQQHVALVTRSEFLTAMDSFAVLAEAVSKTKAPEVKSDSVFKYSNTILRARLRTMQASCTRLAEGDASAIEQLWVTVQHAQTSLSVLLQFKRDAREEVLKTLAEEQASALANHASMTENVASLTTAVAELSAQVSGADATLREATEHANSGTEALEDWATAAKTTLDGEITALVQSARDLEGGASAAATAAVDHKLNAGAAEEAAIASRDQAASFASVLEETHEKSTTALKTVRDAESQMRKHLDHWRQFAQDRESEHRDMCDQLQTRADELVERHTEEYRATAERIESLVAGATGVALGSNFTTEADRSRSMAWVYLAGFVMAILLLVAAQVLLIDVKFDHWWEAVVMRLGVGLSLAWLALFLSRAHATRTRIAEDYAFKAARALTYEGYRKRVVEVDNEGDISQQLLESMLNVISASPVEAADGAKQESPPAQELLEKFAELARDQKKLTSLLSATQLRALREFLNDRATSGD